VEQVAPGGEVSFLFLLDLGLALGLGLGLGLHVWARVRGFFHPEGLESIFLTCLAISLGLI
jgi:hypothetical protein